MGLVLTSEAGTFVPEAATGDGKTRRVRLHRLVDEIGTVEVVRGPVVAEIAGITHDSREVRHGWMFCCVPGQEFDGHDFAAAAAARGASAVLTERLLPVELTQIVVPRTRPAMAAAASAFYGHPSRRLTVVGVTGTNGKTTTTHLLGGILQAAGRPSAVLGTLSGIRTTPEAPHLQARLAELAAAGNGSREAPVTTVAMEVSSHALAQHRVDGTWFTATVFTNLSVDHLDYHGSLEAYFAAKRRLFEPDRTGLAVVNADDPYGRVLLATARVPTRPFSLGDAADLSMGPGGTTFRWHGQRVRLGLGGEFNVSNAVAAASVAHELGIDPSDVAEGLSSVRCIPGRFERVDCGQDFLAVVDYAHTPAGLEQLLRAAGTAAPGGRVIAVFGCGGSRDRTKRPAMGELASRLADVVLLTSDNPRAEDPLAIIEEVRSGVVDPGRVVVEPDRRAAIAAALAAAGPGDIVVVAGKGHETTQVVGDRVLPFDDRAVVREELKRSGRCGP